MATQLRESQKVNLTITGMVCASCGGTIQRGLKKKEYEMDTQKQTGRQGTTSGTQSYKDPVCGMDVDPNKAAGSSIYEGKAYYFCGPGCKQAFDGNPARFLSDASR